MKATKLLLIMMCLMVLQLTTARAQSFTVKSQKFVINGTSSLHDWQSTVEKPEAAGSFVLTGHALTDLRGVSVRIPVKSIKSTKGKTMDNKTWEAFNAEKHPYITFIMTAAKIDANKNTVDVTGNLTMAGVTKAINVRLSYKVLNGNDLQITGSKQLLMTDYKMEPPTAMMGTIKVGDEVNVDFQFVLAHGNTL